MGYFVQLKTHGHKASVCFFNTSWSQCVHRTFVYSFCFHVTSLRLFHLFCPGAMLFSLSLTVKSITHTLRNDTTPVQHGYLYHLTHIDSKSEDVGLSGTRGAWAQKSWPIDTITLQCHLVRGAIFSDLITKVQPNPSAAGKRLNYGAEQHEKDTEPTQPCQPKCLLKLVPCGCFSRFPPNRSYPCPCLSVFWTLHLWLPCHFFSQFVLYNYHPLREKCTL